MWPITRVWVTRLRRTAVEDLGAVFQVVRNPGAALSAIEQAWHLISLGALVISTPEGEQALIATSVQLDGDMLTAIHPDLLQPGREAERDRRTEDHLMKVRTALAPLHEIIRAHRGIKTLVIGMFSGMQGGYWLHFLYAILRSGRDWTSDLAWLASEQLGCWSPMLLHWILPRFLRWRFRARLARLFQDLRQTTHQECNKLAQKANMQRWLT